jgi:parallel beta-helix repeat protein
MLSDMGGIYTLGVQSGTVIRNNLIHDVWAFTYGGWGIYLDEGSSDILAEDNIVYHCKSAGFHQNYGQDNIMRNNIFAFNHDYELMRTRSEPHKSYTFEANIIYFDQGGLLGSNWTSKWQGGEYAFRNNLYYDKRGPQISFAGKSLSEWQSSGMDKNSTIANPLFVDADNYNFHLRDGSPALKMGFHQIDTSRIGPTTRAGANAW